MCHDDSAGVYRLVFFCKKFSVLQIVLCERDTRDTIQTLQTVLSPGIEDAKHFLSLSLASFLVRLFYLLSSMT